MGFRRYTSIPARIGASICNLADLGNDSLHPFLSGFGERNIASRTAVVRVDAEVVPKKVKTFLYAHNRCLRFIQLFAVAEQRGNVPLGITAGLA